MVWSKQNTQNNGHLHQCDQQILNIQQFLDVIVSLWEAPASMAGIIYKKENYAIICRHPTNKRKSRVCSPVVGLPSELCVVLHPRTLPPLSSSPSLVGTCWEHHYLTGLTPPTLPAMKLKRMFSLASWQEPTVGGSAGMRRRLRADAPRPPKIFLLFISSLQ